MDHLAQSSSDTEAVPGKCEHCGATLQLSDGVCVSCFLKEGLEAENQALKGRRSGNLSLKVSEKGGLSVYGLGRFPVTLYKEQWVKLLGMADEIRVFIGEHEAELKTKGDA